MSKSCVICGGEESEGELLVEAPCGNHWVCSDDVASFFERATSNESLFPPKCCGQMFLLYEYEEYVPFDTAWAYQVKEQGEYAILAKYRVYCANRPCAKFLHPSSHVTDPGTDITYAICEDEDCGMLTCCSCRTLLDQGTQNHTCQQTEEEKQFKETATKEGYQECAICGTTVELAEACNHITCECGHEFCYICGRDWPGLHRCPHYGPATYDDEGYNQDGFHRDTGLNREGRSRRQELDQGRFPQEEEGGDDDNEENNEDNDEEENEENEERENEDPEWEILQHIDPAEREVINQLPPEAREDALDNLRIMLHTTEGIIFNQGQAQPQPQPPQPANEADAAPAWGDEEALEEEIGQGGNHPHNDVVAIVHDDDLEPLLAQDDVAEIMQEEEEEEVILQADHSPDNQPNRNTTIDSNTSNIGSELFGHAWDDFNVSDFITTATTSTGEPPHHSADADTANNTNPYEDASASGLGLGSGLGSDPTSSSSDSDDIPPATPMDIDEYADEVEDQKETDRPVVAAGPLGALFDDW